MNGYHPALVQLFSWRHGMHSSWETKKRDAAVVGSFTPVFLFVYGDDQFPNLSVPFQNAMPLATQPPDVLSSPNSLSNFSKFALSLDLAAASESLLLHSSTEAFICAKLNILPAKLCSVLSGEVPMLTKGKQHVEIFVFISRSKTTHIASFLSSDSCFSAAQIAKVSLLVLTVASLDNRLVLNAR